MAAVPEPTLLAAQRDAEANQHLLRGLALLEASTPATLTEAVRCFDAAIELRRQLPLATNPWFRYGLIAGYLNRGDALTRLGATENLAAALASFDEGLRHLRELPMAESPLFVKRLAVAWLNRGIALLKQRLPDTTNAAAESCSEAIAAAKNYYALEPAAGRTLLASAWFNRANALIQLSPPQAAAARAATKQALTLCATSERDDLAVAQISLHTRHVQCQALALLLAAPEGSATQREPLLAEAAETVDLGMALARHWEANASTQLHAPATELFRFGCRVYQIHQPHFLTEFLLENFNPSENANAQAREARHVSAMEALWQTLGALHRDCFRSLNTANFEQTIALFRELRITQEKLEELRRRQPR